MKHDAGKSKSDAASGLVGTSAPARSNSLHQDPSLSLRLIPPTQPWQPVEKKKSPDKGTIREALASSSAADTSTTRRRRRRSSPRQVHPSSLPSYGSSKGLDRLRQARGDAETDHDEAGGSIRRHRSSSIGSPLLPKNTESGASFPGPGSSRSPLLGMSRIRSDSGGSLREMLKRTNSDPFLQKPLHIVSSEMSPLLGGQQHFGSSMSISERSKADSSATTTPLAQDHHELLLHPPPVATHGHVERHMTLLDLIAVGVGGTLGTGIFVYSSVLASSYAGPSSTFCWLLSAIPALLSGFCFAELAGQIPAAGSTYAYVYASMGELPAVVAAGCLSLEYLVSASAVARGWGGKMVQMILTSPIVRDKPWVEKILQPGWSFNPMSFLLSAMVALLLLCGAKESKVVTNYFTLFKVVIVIAMTLTGLGLLEVQNLKPLLPPEFGIDGFVSGGTISFMGFLGYDEVCCMTAEAVEPQKNMPRAIFCSIAILTICYMGATFALSGMLPYNEINSIGGFPDAFESRGVEWASAMASLGELVSLPLVVLVAFMAQPRLQFALACDGLMPAWFGEVDDKGTMRNGTLFAGMLMTLIASFVPLEYLNDLISAGVLVAFSMTNSSLILLRHESPDDDPGLLKRLTTWYNVICFLSSLCLTHMGTSFAGKMLASACCLLVLLVCICIKLLCPAAAYFGGKTRRTTTQHMTVGVVSVVEEYFRTPLLPFVPCLGIFVNWYLVAQLPWSGLAFLALFLLCAVLFYFSFGYFFSVGNNGGWSRYDSCGLSIHSIHSQDGWVEIGNVNVYRLGVPLIHEVEDDGNELSDDYDSAQGLPIESSDGDDDEDFQMDSNLVSHSF